MGERKVLNKYYPPDFDPSLILRRKMDKHRQYQVRMMLPMSVCCNTCGEYMYQGKKFNSKKEDVEGPDGMYLGIRIFRFYMKCTKCNAEFSIITDPKNSDYKCEAGVSRNHEIWKEREEHAATAAQERDDAEEGDAMKALELRTEDSKREMDQLDALDEIKAVNKRHMKINTDKVIALTHDHDLRLDITEEEEKKVRELFASKRAPQNHLSSGTPTPPIESSAPAASMLLKKNTAGTKAIVDDEEAQEGAAGGSAVWNNSSFGSGGASSSAAVAGAAGKGKITIKRKVAAISGGASVTANHAKKAKPKLAAGAAPVSLVGYGGSSSDSDMAEK